MADQLAAPADLMTLVPGLALGTATMLVELATARVQRAAGGQRIVDITDTAVIDVTDPCDLYLPLPQLPVRSVTLVKLDGTTITDWSVREQKLWRAVGWMQSYSPPSQVIAIYAHGYQTGSQWSQFARDATLSLAQMATTPAGAASEAIDDYRITYAEAEARMSMTDAMADSIAAAYGTGTYVTSSR